MCEVCHKWQPELGIQENELCLFEAFAFKSCEVLSAFWKVMLSLLSFSLEKTYFLDGALWDLRGVGEHDMLSVLSYVSCMWCTIHQKSQVWLRSVGMMAVETDNLSSPAEERGSSAGRRGAAYPVHFSLEVKRCLQFHDAFYDSSFFKMLLSVSLCPTSAGAHNMLRLQWSIMWLHRAGGQGHHVDLTLTLEGEHLCSSKNGLFLNESHEAPDVLPVCNHSEPLYSNHSVYVSVSLCVGPAHVFYYFTISNPDPPSFTTWPFWNNKLETV